ncbi:MAG: hypothetical protein DRP56_10540 [Planctomycetota bacterium]|nr:MAG: hypothetical protein DRP56_10540 [Planctomycetota bacterium]
MTTNTGRTVIHTPPPRFLWLKIVGAITLPAAVIFGVWAIVTRLSDFALGMIIGFSLCLGLVAVVNLLLSRTNFLMTTRRRQETRDDQTASARSIAMMARLLPRPAPQPQAVVQEAVYLPQVADTEYQDTTEILLE